MSDAAVHVSTEDFFTAVAGVRGRATAGSRLTAPDAHAGSATEALQLVASAVNDLEAAVMAGRGRIADTMTISGIAAITADDQGIPPDNVTTTSAPAAETPAAAPPAPVAEPSDAPVNAAPPTTVPGS